jgi:hypothetical protein
LGRISSNAGEGLVVDFCCEEDETKVKGEG